MTTHHDAGPTVEAELIDTPTFASREGCVLAINANFFGKPKPGLAEVIGLQVSDGRVISSARVFNGVADPAAGFTRSREPRFGRLTDADAAGLWDVVAGVGDSPSEAVGGTLLVTDGVNTGATARLEPSARHPRTAIGVTADGRALIVMVIDGRQPEWSVGVTLPELADMMIEAGADRALALDGGGSSAFVYNPTPGSAHAPLRNRPSDGAFRPVSTNFGVRLIAGGSDQASP